MGNSWENVGLGLITHRSHSRFKGVGGRLSLPDNLSQARHATLPAIRYTRAPIQPVDAVTPRRLALITHRRRPLCLLVRVMAIMLNTLWPDTGLCWCVVLSQDANGALCEVSTLTNSGLMRFCGLLPHFRGGLVDTARHRQAEEYSQLFIYILLAAMVGNFKDYRGLVPGSIQYRGACCLPYCLALS